MFNFWRNFQKCLQVGYVSKTGDIFVTKRNSSSANVSKDLTLYGDYSSPPVRFVMITAKLLNIELNFHDIDLFKSEQKSEYYKKINPLKKVPALAVGDKIIRDSHAIALYLCRRSDQQDLYPNDVLLKAQVDEMLYFNATTLFPIDSGIYFDYFSGKWPPVESKLNNWYGAVDYLESKLTMNTYFTGEKMMLCDLCCHQTILSLEVIVPLLERHSRVKEWMQAIKNNISCNHINERGLDRLKDVIKRIGPALDS